MIMLTDTAATKVRQLIEAEDEDGLALRVEVHPGGCSGFTYQMYFDTNIGEDDVTVEYPGVRVVVDRESVAKLDGAQLDYTDGLDQSGFAITNPSAEHSCGCGKSFS